MSLLLLMSQNYAAPGLVNGVHHHVMPLNIATSVSTLKGQPLAKYYTKLITPPCNRNSPYFGVVYPIMPPYVWDGLILH